MDFEELKHYIAIKNIMLKVLNKTNQNSYNDKKSYNKSKILKINE